MKLTPIFIIGIDNYDRMNPHLFGFILGFLLMLYTIGEEIGWRGYLNESLKPMKLILRSLMIGSVWWFWHLPFIKGSWESGHHLAGTLTSHLVYWGMLVGVSALFISIVD